MVERRGAYRQSNSLMPKALACEANARISMLGDANARIKGEGMRFRYCMDLSSYICAT